MGRGCTDGGILRRGIGTLNENELIARARDGDVAAYEELVARHRDAAVRTALSITGDADEAEDATQEALLKAQAALGRYREGAPFRPWILAIVANEARNRRKAVGRRVGLARRATEASFPEAAPSPEAAVLERERRDALAGAINGLRADDRRVIAYRYLLGLSEAEMANSLGCARGTVKSRLARALGRLRHRLVAAVLALLALIAATLAAWPDAREAVAERLGLRGVRIFHVPGTFAPPPIATPASAPSVPHGDRLGLGRPVASFEEARRQVGYEVVSPTVDGLRAPDEVNVSPQPAPGQVALLYHTAPGLTPAAETGIALLFTQFRGELAPEFIRKGLGPSSRVEEVGVGGGRGLWIEGAPHFFMFRDRSGRVADERVRLAANVLLWERGGLTLRLEGRMTRDVALTIASSVR